MSNLPFVGICTAAAKTNVDLVWEAMGRGPGTFSRKVCAVGPGVTWQTAATHYLSSDASATDSDIAIWQGFAAANLPPLPEGVVWGENGVIGAAAAIAAISGANLQVYSVSGDVLPVDHIAGILAGRGLRYVPDEPI